MAKKPDLENYVDVAERLQKFHERYPEGSLQGAANAFRDGGFGYLVCGWPSEGHARVEDFVKTVMPEFSD